MTSMAYDKFTLGAECVAGDPIDLPNVMMQMTARGSFEPRKEETSRVVAAGALVAAMRHTSPVELSVSSAKGEAPPTAEEWSATLAAL